MDIQSIADQAEEANLKSQALLERVADLTREYENKVADLRVVVTKLSNEVGRYKQQIADMEAQTGAEHVPDAVVEGEVVE